MLVVLIIVTIAIAVWARVLVWRRRAPAWVVWVGVGSLASTALVAIVTLRSLHRTFDALHAINPAERQARLASGIAGAMWILAAGCVVAIVATIVLSYFSLRRARDPNRG